MWVAILPSSLDCELFAGRTRVSCLLLSPAPARPGPAQTLGGTGLRDGSEQRLPRESWER